ncbi:MAG: hypothetical protein GQ574_24830 [Crocinitomix sp.]|nr:hypothetical protein [Crocinitomix sp.]
MKRLKFTVIAVVLTTLISCGGGSANQEATADGFTEIQNEFKSKFGDNAYYTDLDIVYDESIGNIINTIVTSEPESLKMAEWSQSQGAWTETSEVSLEIPEGTKATDFMFQLGDEISLTELGGLIEKAKLKLKEEKDLANPTLSIASIIFPDDGDVSNASYSISLNPENGGTTFRFSYSLDGELLDMDY